jgi:putative lipase involved disintegration of autophagic bodies
MKAHIGVDAEIGPIHTVECTTPTSPCWIPA